MSARSTIAAFEQSFAGSRLLFESEYDCSIVPRPELDANLSNSPCTNHHFLLPSIHGISGRDHRSSSMTSTASSLTEDEKVRCAFLHFKWRWQFWPKERIHESKGFWNWIKWPNWVPSPTKWNNGQDCVRRRVVLFGWKSFQGFLPLETHFPESRRIRFIETCFQPSKSEICDQGLEICGRVYPESIKKVALKRWDKQSQANRITSS